MNTVYLARLLGRHLAVEDAGNLPDDAALDVVSAINEGLEDFYRLAPATLRRTTFSATLRAPEDVNLVFAGQYANTLSSPTFEARQIGCTLQAGRWWHQIATPTTVLDDWLDTTLSLQGRVFSDALAINARIAEITSDVRIHSESAPQGRPLVPDDSFGRMPLHGHSWNEIGHPAIGSPGRYKIDTLGLNQGGEAACLLRVFPLPDADCTIRFEAELSGARRVTFADLSDAVDLPVAATYCESILAPLCEGALITSRFWADSRTKGTVESRAAGAREKLALIPQRFAPSNNRCGTARGF